MRKLKLFLLKMKKAFTINKLKFVIILLISIPLLFWGANFLVDSYMENQSLTKGMETAIEEPTETAVEDITTLLMNFELP